MTSKERFRATVERRPVNRAASWRGIPATAGSPGLLEYVKAGNEAELKQAIGDDVDPIENPCHSEFSNAIYMAFDFAKKGHLVNEEPTLNSPGWFEDITDPAAVEDFAWPDSHRHISRDECRAAGAALPLDRSALGVVWSAHFPNACAAFGMETALMNMFAEPEMFRMVIVRITRFYLEANAIFNEATRSRLDAVLIGNDFGSQTGLMLSGDLICVFVFPGTRALVSQAKDCDQVAFCGGVEAQELLAHGTREAVQSQVRQLVARFPTGLVVSPSHEAMQPDLPPRNIEALFAAVRKA